MDRGGGGHGGHFPDNPARQRFQPAAMKRATRAFNAANAIPANGGDDHGDDDKEKKETFTARFYRYMLKKSKNSVDRLIFHMNKMMAFLAVTAIVIWLCEVSCCFFENVQ